MSIITIATDFGTSDGYTAALFGVMKSILPESEIISITDSLTSIRKTSLVITRYCFLYPQGTVHLVIVDPTVGTVRRPLVGTNGKYFFVGPDNGIFTQIILANPEMTWFEIDRSKLPAGEISNTFHGRDIFASAAALLSSGIAPDELGRRVNDPMKLDIPVPVQRENAIQGEIIDVDSFGNLIINIPGNMLKISSRIMMGDLTIPLGKTFADVEPGKPIAYIGSLGFLEIAVNMDRADKFPNIGVGSKVMVTN
jgi:S-adenosyl-L-methionine hydrolase (adenosine-forming)